jgi:hypothetical protein
VGAEVSAAAASRTNPHVIKTLLRVVLFVTFAPLSSRLLKAARNPVQVFAAHTTSGALAVSMKPPWHCQGPPFGFIVLKKDDLARQGNSRLMAFLINRGDRSEQQD